MAQPCPPHFGNSPRRGRSKKLIVGRRTRKALEASAALDMSCDIEPNFSSLYPHLGNRPEMDAIGFTCRYLEASSTACLCIPKKLLTFKPELAEKVCVMNKFEFEEGHSLFQDNREALRLVRKYGGRIETALDWISNRRAGVPFDLSEIPSEEWAVATAAWEWEDSRDSGRSTDLIQALLLGGRK